MADKEEGAEMKCKGCGTLLVCHMSTYQNGFENKLQWQNSDGSAHFKWTGPGKFDCVKGKDAPTTPQEQVQSSEAAKPSPKTLSKIPRFDADGQSVVRGDALTLIMIREEVIDFLKQFFEDPHKGMVWEMTNIIFQKNFKANFKKASET